MAIAARSLGTQIFGRLCAKCCTCGTNENRPCECGCRCPRGARGHLSMTRVRVYEPLKSLPGYTWPEPRGRRKT